MNAVVYSTNYTDLHMVMNRTQFLEDIGLLAHKI